MNYYEIKEPTCISFWESMIGIRYDEPRRIAKQLKTNNYIPLHFDKITKENVSEFWRNQSFDLNLPNDNGTTSLGNCDLCFLKGFKKRQSIIRERPDLADWWIESEEIIGATFRKDNPPYSEMLKQSALDFDQDDNLPCYCTD